MMEWIKNLDHFLGQRTRSALTMVCGLTVFQFVLLVGAFFSGMGDTRRDQALQSGAPIHRSKIEKPALALLGAAAKPLPAPKSLDRGDWLLSSIAKLASSAGLVPSKVKLLPPTSGRPSTLTMQMVAPYTQYKQFLSRSLQTEHHLVLQKLTMQRLPVPATGVSAEVTMAILPSP
jgi:hypothetical protein